MRIWTIIRRTAARRHCSTLTCTTMNLQFDHEKAVQVAAEILRHYPNHQTTRLVLVKLLYLANRMSLEEKGIPMVPDRYCAMEHGPILSATLDLISGRDAWYQRWSAAKQLWARAFSNRVDQSHGDHRIVKLDMDQSGDLLSEYERAVIRTLVGKYKGRESALYRDVHDLPEYKECWPTRGERRSVDIPLASLLSAVGRTDVSDAELCNRQLRAENARRIFKRAAV